MAVRLNSARSAGSRVGAWGDGSKFSPPTYAGARGPDQLDWPSRLLKALSPVQPRPRDIGGPLHRPRCSPLLAASVAGTCAGCNDWLLFRLRCSTGARRHAAAHPGSPLPHARTPANVPERFCRRGNLAPKRSCPTPGTMLSAQIFAFTGPENGHEAKLKSFCTERSLMRSGGTPLVFQGRARAAGFTPHALRRLRACQPPWSSIHRYRTFAKNTMLCFMAGGTAEK
jgi:hypothetical protein